MFYNACPLEQKLDIQEMVDRIFLWKGCACGKEVTSPTHVQMVQGSILPPNRKMEGPNDIWLKILRKFKNEQFKMKILSKI